ncbi:UNVERIFIED_ORG: glycerol-3-phosphate acyltransferase PlsY [Heyndrickxia coagulans]
MTFLLSALCFLSGSLMFSYWIGLLLNLNIRKTGDGNPGAANLWTKAGYKYGLLGIAGDFGKGFLPVWLIIKSGAVPSHKALIPIALAPIAGHAFSPFLKGNGGKGLAVSFGVWSALTKFRISLTYAVILACFYVLAKVVKKGKKTTSSEDSLQTATGFLLLSLFLIFQNSPRFLLWIWLGNFIILLWKNKKALMRLKKEKHFTI